MDLCMGILEENQSIKDFDFLSLHPMGNHR